MEVMKPDEILKLIDAGYTKEEIQAMDQPQEPIPEEPQQEEPIPEPHDIDQQPARDAQALDEVRQELKTTQQQLADLVKQMQRNTGNRSDRTDTDRYREFCIGWPAGAAGGS